MHCKRIIFTGVITLVLSVGVLSANWLGSSGQSNRQMSSETGSGGRRNAPRNLEAMALSKVAKRSGRAVEDLQITSSSTATFPVSGRVAYEYSIRSKRDGSSDSILLDNGGNELDRNEILEEERAARAAKYGKLDEKLVERLVNAAPNELIPVQITLAEADDEATLPKQQPMTGERWNKMTERERTEYEDQEEAVVKRRRDVTAAQVKQLVEPVVERLRQRHYECRVEDGAAIIYADLEASVIKEVESWREVERISIRGTTQNSLDVSRVTIGADLVEARGVPGLRSVQTAIVESAGSAFDPGGGNVAANPYLTNTTQNFSNICQAVSAHGTAIAGIIESTHSLVRGIDTTAGVWAGGSCNGVDAELQTAIQNAITFGAKVINCSFNRVNDNTSVQDFDRFMDRMVKVNRVSIVVSVGNSGTPCAGNGNVGTPAKAYTIIPAGAFDDLNTTQWDED